MRVFLPRAACFAWTFAGLAACASTNTHREPPAAPAVTAADLERNADAPIEQVLQSKVPSLAITRAPDGSIAVLLRGPASFYGSNAPLYVLDEVPMQPAPGGVLTGLNPYDIESIRVLKNPADIGIYGMRGANGVIVITTKRPGKGS